MHKLIAAIFLLLFPVLAMADTSALNFTPPGTDYSVVFLGELFGHVDGVLFGSGSQIMGAIFTVFNAAVLALGGIVIMYTLIVGTMNTAHEGEMLGKKWSSIWIPVRSTMGLALLIPKASGYCLMQVFVMWVIVQGVGAADLVWNAALDYLNKGGVIIQAGMTPSIPQNADTNAITGGAAAMLAGEVCMLGLQKQLEARRESYLKNADFFCPTTQGSNASPTPQQILCTTVVPDFIAETNILAVQTRADTAANDALNALSDDDYCIQKLSNSLPGARTYVVPMPDLTANPQYASLTGVCGSIKWSSFAPENNITCTRTQLTHKKKKKVLVVNKVFWPQTVTRGADTYSPYTATGRAEANAEANAENNARGAAVQQMYTDYTAVAQTMVQNDPAINPPPDTSTTPDYEGLATHAFGVPYLSGIEPCTTPNMACVTWGSDPAKSSAPLFTGTEFWYAINDYNAIMKPVIESINKTQSDKNENDQRAFIAEANEAGWLTAGSYFFDLVHLNDSIVQSVKITDKNTGLGNSVAPASEVLLGGFPEGSDGTGCNASSPYVFLCQLFNMDRGPVDAVMRLINNNDVAPVPSPPIPITSSTTAVSGQGASTVYGFITNAQIIQNPSLDSNSPGVAPEFSFLAKVPEIKKDDRFKLPSLKGPKGNVFNLIGLGQTIFNEFYNYMLKPVVNFIMDLLYTLIAEIITACVYYPLQFMSSVFITGVEFLTDDPSTNPIVALAKMGVYYINTSMQMFLDILFLTAASLGYLTPIVAMCMPLIIAWMGIMVGIGFTTAYYVPFLPYMIFTFGVIAWLMAVIEAMVAAPIVALGITHPEGEGVMGSKGEQALMILMNVFLRPALMIIGFIAAIALSYVSVWIINAGFSHVMNFTQGATYSSWAQLYGFFFAILIYTTMYLMVVQKAFGLIYLLPDKVLRWIGGHPESAGEAAAGWTEESKKQVDQGGDKTGAAGAEATKKVSGGMVAAVAKVKEGFSRSGGAGVEATGSSKENTKEE